MAGDSASILGSASTAQGAGGFTHRLPWQVGVLADETAVSSGVVLGARCAQVWAHSVAAEGSRSPGRRIP